MSKKPELDARILDAAVNEFLEMGFPASSMERISKVADVSKRTLYKYYSNKEELYYAIVDKVLEAMDVYANLKFDKDQPLGDQLDKVLDSKVKMIRSEEYLRISKLVISEMIRGKAIHEDQLGRFYQLEQNFISWIEEAKKCKVIQSKKPSEIIANEFHSILKGQIFWPAILGFAQPSELDVERAKASSKEYILSLS